jgi:hypothetical protein
MALNTGECRLLKFNASYHYLRSCWLLLSSVDSILPLRPSTTAVICGGSSRILALISDAAIRKPRAQARHFVNHCRAKNLCE